MLLSGCSCVVPACEIWYTLPYTTFRKDGILMGHELLAQLNAPVMYAIVALAIGGAVALVIVPVVRKALHR